MPSRPPPSSDPREPTLPAAGVEPAGQGTRPASAEAAPPSGFGAVEQVAFEPTVASLPVGLGGAPVLKQVTLLPVDDGDPPARAAESYVGYVIDARYVIEGVIAQGGMGVVYRARHRLLDKLVAVKVLRPELAHNRDITRRFLVEAQAASAIGSEHIIDITDFGELPDGATYIVMEYLDGAPLSRLLETTGPLAPARALHIARQLAEGLERAHVAGIVHRDLKPDNVVLVQLGKRSDFAKILDFGIAKVASSQNDTTRAGKIFGTPHYMSPEQARGESLDARTDVYALGVMLFEMLTGKLPFAAENPLGVLTQHMYVEPPLLCDVLGKEAIDVAWEALVGRCLAKQRTDRYASMAELEADLDRIERGEAPLALGLLLSNTATPARLAQRLGGSAPARKASNPSGLALAALLLLMLTLLLALVRGRDWVQRAQAWLDGSSEGADDEANLKTIALVLSPIDAHVFRGKEDLGMMPISVRIRPGQRVTLSVRRPGYKSKTITVDGSASRVQVELQAGTGGKPPVPPLSASTPLGKPRTITLAPDPEQSPSGPATPAPNASQDAGEPVPRQLPSGELVPILPPVKPEEPPGPPPRSSDTPGGAQSGFTPGAPPQWNEPQPGPEPAPSPAQDESPLDPMSAPSN